MFSLASSRTEEAWSYFFLVCLFYIHSNKKGKTKKWRTGLSYNVVSQWACWTLCRIGINFENCMTENPVSASVRAKKLLHCRVLYVTSFLSYSSFSQSVFSEREDAGIVRVSCNIYGISEPPSFLVWILGFALDVIKLQKQTTVITVMLLREQIPSNEQALYSSQELSQPIKYHLHPFIFIHWCI